MLVLQTQSVRVSLMEIIITEKLHKICTTPETCHCQDISGDKACSLVDLVNTFLTPTNPIKVTMSNEDWQAFRLYVTIASLRGRG